MADLIDLCFNLFETFYPVVMSLFWIVGSLFYYFQMTKRQARLATITDFPGVSVIVAAHNELATLAETVAAIAKFDYQRYELILVDDCSDDGTPALIEQLRQQYQGQLVIRAILLNQNRGKAHALNKARGIANYDYYYVIDADSLPFPDSLTHLMQRLLSDAKLGAVTGNPIVRNRSTQLARLQTLEYMGIINNIKRSQDFWLGRITTVSGVMVVYRKKALATLGGWNEQVMTEDIDATWHLYRQGWRVGYQADAYTYILVPESVRGLYRQRLRWAVGGLEVMQTNLHEFRQFGWAEKLMLSEMLISHLWAWCFIISTLQYLVIGWFGESWIKLNGQIILIYLLTGLLTFFVGKLTARAQFKFSFSDSLLLPFYFFFYWILNLITALASEFVIVFGKTNQGRWQASDRGK